MRDSDISSIPVIIVAGGRGTRLGLGDHPKAMVDVAGTPLLDRTIVGLIEQGIRKIVVLAGHGAAFISEHLAKQNFPDTEIEVLVESHPRGTAGCFDMLRKKLNGPFIVVYGDILFDVDLKRFVRFAKQRGGHGTLYAHPNDHPFDSDLIDADKNGRVRRIIAKPHDNAECGNLVNAAFYYFDRAILSFIPTNTEGSLDWGKDILPIVARDGALFAYKGTEYIKDIGTPDRLRRGALDLSSGKVATRSYRRPQRAIFLDRDGVLNSEVNGVLTPDDLVLLPGVAGAIAKINQSPFLAICVTNQPFIAKGFMSFADLDKVHWRLDKELAQSGSFLDDLLFCPHHPERGFAGEVLALKIDCNCRKPKAGMLIEASRRHNIDLRQSFIVGDNIRDMQAGLKVGATCYLVAHDEANNASISDFRLRKSLVEVVDEILAKES